MPNFDEMLEKIHESIIEDDEKDMPIEITSNRTFKVPDEYNTILGYVGDANSQIVTFKIPLKHENHNLSECENKRLYWKNLSNEKVGFSNLEILEKTTDYFLLQWLVPQEIFTSSGQIEISISLYDLEGNTKVFSWNTTTAAIFSIGSNSQNIIPENLILKIDEKTRNIVAPVGYNKVIANVGDQGITRLYFQVNKNICGIDVSDSSSEKYILYNQNYEVRTKPLYILSQYSKDQVILYWDVVNELINQNVTFNIAIALSSSEGEVPKRWISNPFSGLTIGTTLIWPEPEGGDDLLPEEGEEGEEGTKSVLISGDAYDSSNSGDAVTYAGYVTLRSLTSTSNKEVHKNELVVLYDNGTIVGVGVGKEEKDYDSANVYRLVGQERLQDYLTNEQIEQNYLTKGEAADKGAEVENNISTLNKKITNLEYVASGNTYNFEIDDDIAHYKSIPYNVAPYAELNSVGGMSYIKEVASVQNDASFTGLDGTESVGLTFDYNEVTRVITINGTATADNTNFLPMERFELTNNKACGVIEKIGGSVSAETVCLAFIDAAIYIGNFILKNSNEKTKIEFEGVSGVVNDFALWGGANDGKLEGVTFYNYQFRIDLGDKFDNEIVDTPVTAVKVAGKNLLPESVKSIDRWDVTTASNGAFRYNYPLSLPLGTYTINTLAESITSGASFMLQRSVNGGAYNTIETLLQGNTVDRVPYKFTVSAGERYRLYLTVASALDDIINGLQLEAGNTATAYTPYTERLYVIPEAVQELDGYGIGINENHYNYIDFDAKKFVRMVSKREFQDGDVDGDTMLTDGTNTIYALDIVETEDVSEYLSFDNFIEVEGNGWITTENENKNKQAAPSSITYQIKLTNTEA